MHAKLDRLLILLNSGIAQRRLYFAGHPKVKAYSRDFVSILQEILAETSKESLFVGVVQGKLVYEGRYLVGPSIAGGQLVAFVENLNSGGLGFSDRITSEEVDRLLALSEELQDPVDSLQDARELFASRGIRSIELAAHHDGEIDIAGDDEQTPWRGKDGGGNYLDSPILMYQALFNTVTAAHGNAAFDRSIDIDEACSVSERLLHSVSASFTDMMLLVHYPEFDSYTVGHSVRVAVLAVFMGGKLGMSEEKLLELGTAGLLHDVGKSKIPDEILFKPGRLTEEEHRIMQSHAPLGAEILLEHRNATPMTVAAAWGHHIRFDGGGYPLKPQWAERSMVTALLHVCDVYEALTAIRPYKSPMTPQRAYDIMLKDEGAFDPYLLTQFVRTLGLYPPGNQVRLSDETLGVVVETGSELDRPLVRITHDFTGNPIADKQQRIVDLATADDPDLKVRELILDSDSVIVGS